MIQYLLNMGPNGEVESKKKAPNDEFTDRSFSKLSGFTSESPLLGDPDSSS
jgi:hypothetical protein